MSQDVAKRDDLAPRDLEMILLKGARDVSCRFADDLNGAFQGEPDLRPSEVSPLPAGNNAEGLPADRFMSWM